MPDPNNIAYKTLLGFDFGMKHIGVAVGQSITHTASPLITLKAKDGIPTWTEIGSLIEKWKPTALIVGMPLQMDDAKQLMSFAAKRFMNRLYMHFKLPVFEVDERLSSWEALDRRNAAGNYAKTREDRNKMHAEAAALLLEQWMRETPTN